MTKTIQNIAFTIGGISFLWFLGLTLSFFSPFLDTPDPLVPLRAHLSETGGPYGSSDDAVQEYRRAFFLDKSIVDQFAIYGKNSLHGEFGASVRNYPQPTLRMILGPATHFIPTLVLLVIFWIVSLQLGVKLALSVPNFARWIGWVSLPFLGLILWKGKVVPFSLSAFAFFFFLPMVSIRTLQLKDQNHLRFAMGMGIPETHLKKIIKANVLRTFLPTLPILLVWSIGLSFVIEGIWQKPSLATLLISAKANADFSLVRSSGFFLFLVLTLPAFLLYTWKPVVKAPQSELHSQAWYWTDLFLLGLTGYLIVFSSNPVPVLCIATFAAFIRYATGDKIPPSSPLLHIILVPTWLLSGQLSALTSLILSLVTVHIAGIRERSWTNMLRNSLLLFVWISLVQLLHTTSIPLP